MKVKAKGLAITVAIMLLLSLVPVIALTANAEEKEDAMIAIEESLGSYRAGDVTTVANDGYIGIPVEVSVYHDASKTVKDGLSVDATPVIIYVVNTAIPRIGTESDVSIIQSMLNRGYVVVIFDYLNNSRAVSPDLDWSVQGLRPNVNKGKYFEGIDGLGTGNYINNLVVPAGYNVSMNNVFFELDKHGTEGTFEKIVEVWNNDFRSWNKNREIIIPWVDGDGNRKATQVGHDGTEPQWLNANGEADENGTYVRIKHTKAEKITDCVMKDGSPLDLNLYMHVVYPTSPENAVPVMVLASSSGHLAGGTQTADRPQFNGFLFNGYAAATFDHAYVPMARDDHYGYFDGSTPASGSVTGYNVTYSVHFNNDVNIHTAAMRYLRYLSASEHGTYSFIDTAIGVYGNSKGGWATMLGEEHPEDLVVRNIYPGFDGSTRYEAGNTETVGVIDGGEEQPWLSFGGNVLDSGADFIYSSCGGGSEQITASHCPTFISCNTGDGSYYSTSNQFVNACRSMNVPALWFEVAQGHTFASAEDTRFGVNTYDALFTFANYFLRGDAVSVIYAHRAAEYSGMPTNGAITVKFSGPVSAEQAALIVLKDSEGNTVSGCTMTSQFGNTEWTIATPTLKGDTEYTLTVPAGVKADNGKEMAEAYTLTFRTGYENAEDANTVTTDSGTYYYFTVPSDSEVLGKALELYTLRIRVNNDAANSLKVYPLSGFDPSAPDASTVGTLLTTVPLSGAGAYDVDVTDTVKATDAGNTAAFLIKIGKSAGQTTVSSSSLENTLGSVSVSGKAITAFGTAPDGTNALRFDYTNSQTGYTNCDFYSNPNIILGDNTVIKSSNLLEEDIGRKFHISFRVYDTVSRIITVRMNSLTNQSRAFADYNAYFLNFYTEAGKWVDIEFDYVVYEPLYAAERGYVRQQISIMTTASGEDSEPLYVRDLLSVETVTDVDLGAAELLLGTTEQREDPLVTEYGLIPESYASEKDYPYVLFDRNGNCIAAGSVLMNSSGTSGVLSSTQSSTSITSFPNNDYVLLVRDNVDFAITYDNFSFLFGKLLIDLDGHTFTMSGTFFNTFAKRCGAIEVTVKNGTLLQGTSSLITLDGMSASNYPYADYGVREFNFIFENITLGYKDGVTARPFITRNNSPVPVKSTVSFTDCIFDLRGVTVDSSFTLLNACTDSNNNVTTAITVNGSTLKADSLDGIKIGEASGNGSFSVKMSSNDYLAVELPSSAAAPTDSFVVNGKGASYVEKSTADGITTYKLDSDPCWTPYGQIPANYSSTEKYPFATFRVNEDGTYTFLLVEKDVFLDASNSFIKSRTVPVVIYMRRNYTVTNSFNNYGWCKFDTTIDLGGNTLTYGGYNNPMTLKKAWDKHISFKNGTIVESGNAAALFSFAAGADGAGYGYYLTFDDIIFDLSDYKAAFPLMAFNATSSKMTANLTFNNCTFRLGGAIRDGGITLFTAGLSGSGWSSAVTVMGGKIIAETLTDVNLFSAPGSGCSVTFGKYGGAYTGIECSDSASVPSYKVNTAEGEMIYAHTEDNGGTQCYTLISPDLATTKYGDMPYKYAFDEKYPFVQFKVDGNGYSFLDAASSIFEEANKLMFNARSQTTVILMRRDFTKTDSQTHSNLCHVNGTLTIDMGGHTLSILQGSAYNANAKKNILTSNIIFKDGTVVMKDNAFITTSSTFSDAPAGVQTFNFTFDGVTFRLAEGGTATYLTVRLGNSGVRNYVVNTTYVNCTVDLTGAKTGTAVYESGTSDGKVTGTVTVKGGKIVGLTVGNHVITKVHNADSKVLFDRLDGKYITIRATGDTASVVLDTVSEGKAILKATEGGYILTPCTHLYDGVKDAECNLCGTVREIVDPGFVVKVNLTLASEISLNFYTPAGGNVTGISVDGVALVSEGTVVMDGVTYEVYRFLGIAPSKAMEGHTVVITYLEDGNTLTREIEYSALNYAKSVLTNATISEAGKAIVRDMLGFAKAAYDYFGNEDATEEEVELLGTLTSQYPATAVESIPTVDGVDPSGIASVVESAQLSLGNGVIKMVLNVKDASKPLTVTADGKTVVSLGADHGKAQVTVELRAYQIGEVLTITSGEQIGTYCFYEYARAMMGEDDKLDALLLAMHAYSVSAKSYRAESN